jgi:hypothetical protein
MRRHHRFVHEYGFWIDRVGSELRFVRPDGRVVPAVPSGTGVEAREGVRALVGMHERGGLGIGARTGVPKWFGERMDYGEAVGTLRERTIRTPVLPEAFRSAMVQTPGTVRPE